MDCVVDTLTQKYMNPLTSNVSSGTLGELLVQIRLFEYGVQASPPIKDSGNDLIAIKEDCFRAVQVKTRTTELFSVGELPERYHILALVSLVARDGTLHLDESRVYLVPRSVVESKRISRFDQVEEYLINRSLVESLFS